MIAGIRDDCDLFANGVTSCSSAGLRMTQNAGDRECTDINDTKFRYKANRHATRLHEMIRLWLRRTRKLSRNYYNESSREAARSDTNTAQNSTIRASRTQNMTTIITRASRTRKLANLTNLLRSFHSDNSLVRLLSLCSLAILGTLSVLRPSAMLLARSL